MDHYNFDNRQEEDLQSLYGTTDPIGFATAEYDFNSHKEDELSFTVGDSMEILDYQDGQWWLARHSESGEVGYIPANYMTSVQDIDSPNQHNNGYKLDSFASSVEQKSSYELETVGHNSSYELETAHTPDSRTNDLETTYGDSAVERIVSTLYAYEAREDQELSFKAGDVIGILDDTHPDWWVAKHSKSGRIGYAPSNYVSQQGITSKPECWYHKDVTRKDAEEALLEEDQGIGAFLVRDSVTNPGQLSLSVLDFDKNKQKKIVKHYKIEYDDSEGYLLNINRVETQGMYFETVSELVKHHSVQKDGLCQILRTPCVQSNYQLIDD